MRSDYMSQESVWQHQNTCHRKVCDEVRIHVTGKCVPGHISCLPQARIPSYGTTSYFWILTIVLNWDFPLGEIRFNFPLESEDHILFGKIRSLSFRNLGHVPFGKIRSFSFRNLGQVPFRKRRSFSFTNMGHAPFGENKIISLKNKLRSCLFEKVRPLPFVTKKNGGGYIPLRKIRQHFL